MGIYLNSRAAYTLYKKDTEQSYFVDKTQILEELNMFLEYNMAAEEKYSQYFGFTEEEVDLLFDRYLDCTVEPHLTRDGLQSWYDGYYSKSGRKLYNPRSVVTSLKNNNFGNYWTSSGPYDEIYYYIEHNVAAVDV